MIRASAFARRLSRRRLPINTVLRRSYNFGTREYTVCFLDLPQPVVSDLRRQAIDYLDNFDANLWHSQPVTSILNGRKLEGSHVVDTVDALGNVNGKQVLADSGQIQELKEHIRTFKSPYKDLRREIRAIEREILVDHAGFLIGNQSIDFQKQDGITEIEEAIMANTIERRLNDMLLQDDGAKIIVNRELIYVSSVSNFSSFLDLSRKTLRSLELGIPCIILARSNTTQHSYRWAKLLSDMLVKADIDPGMLVFLSCSLDDIKEITASCQENTGNLYATCSRDLANSITSQYPKTVASTGGPNTLVTTELSSNIKQAIRVSASIESSGQCTALRHCVVPPGANDHELMGVFDDTKSLSSATEAVRESMFNGVFSGHKGSKEPDGYAKHSSTDAFAVFRDELPPPGIQEYWRKVVVDFSRLDLTDQETIESLAAWLNQNQPISLAVNAPRATALQLGIQLFEKTGMVVNTIGSSDNDGMPPALTCQARPQDGEVFGEFPPRKEFHKFTRFPVIVPSSNPSYDTVYADRYLHSKKVGDFLSTSTKNLLGAVHSGLVRGYCVELIEYLQDATARNPKLGFGRSRTVLFGLQRPPLGTKTVIHCGVDTKWDDVAPIYMLFHVSNARHQVELSIDGNNELVALCNAGGLEYVSETKEQMDERLDCQSNVFNVVHPTPMTSFPLVGLFTSLYFPLGHIKSTMAEDNEFVLRGKISNKWLHTLF